MSSAGEPKGDPPVGSGESKGVPSLRVGESKTDGPSAAAAVPPPVLPLAPMFARRPVVTLPITRIC